MSFPNWLSSIKYRSLLCGNARVRRDKSRPRITPELMQLEGRCLPSVFTPVLPPRGTEQSSDLNEVVYTPEGDKNFNQANLPAAKLVTIMNNSSNVVFPIFYGANSTPDNTAGQVVRLVLTNPGSGYSNNSAYPPPTVEITGGHGTDAAGTVKANDGLYGLTLTNVGHGYQVGDVLTVTFNDDAHFKMTGKRGTGATATAIVSAVTQNGVKALYDPRDTLNITYRGYIGEFNPVTKANDLGLQPGHQVTVMVPIAFWDGGRFYFATNGSVPLSSEADPGYPLQNNPEWLYNPSTEKTVIQSYIVAPSQPGDMPLYGADFADPNTKIANPNGVVMWYRDASKPQDFGFGVPAVVTEMTLRDPKQPYIAPDMLPSEIDTIENYDVSYVDSLALPASMEGTQVPTEPPTPAQTNLQSQYAWLGSDLSTTQMQQAIATFTTNDLNGGGETPGGANGLGTYFGGLGYDQYYMPPDTAQTTGVHVQKLPAGFQVIADSENQNVQSSFDPTRYNLVSGGVKANISTVGTGVSTAGTNTILNVSNAIASQLVPGMLWSPVTARYSSPLQPFFPYGTTIASITVGMGVGNTSTITMSNDATLSGSPGGSNNDRGSGGSWTFNGSQYTSGTGSIVANRDQITGLDPSVGIYLRPGMLVTGSQIPARTYIAANGISSDLKTITLTQSIGSTPSSGPYTFLGSPSSYIVQTLINVWYAWADYYVKQLASGANAAPTGSFSATTTANGGRTDDNSLILKINGPATGPGSFDMTKLRVGDVVTGTSTPPAAISGISNTTGPITITTGSTTGLVNGGQVTISGVTGQAAINGTWTIFNLNPPEKTFQLVGSQGNGATLSGGSWSVGTTLTPNPFNEPSLNYTIVSFDPTARTVELSLPVAVTGAVSDTFNFAAPQYIVRSSDAPKANGTAGTIPYTLDFTSGGAKALKFAQTVYDVMQSFSLLLDPGSLLSRSALLLRYSIGGNVGSFVANNGLIPGRPTSLPHDRTHVELRDEIKSILRGVYSFTAVPDQSQWYPNPATPTQGATLDQGSGPKDVTFGIYNLSPYVWFVHVVLHNSSYGFSLDDDVANTTAKSSSIEIAVGGNSNTAAVDTTKTPPLPAGLLNPEAYSNGAQYGTQTSDGFIDVTSAIAKKYLAEGMTTISGLSQVAVARLKASTKKSDPLGAFITSDSLGLLPPTITVALAQANPPVGGMDNQSFVTFVTPDKWTAPLVNTPAKFTFSGFSGTTVPSNIAPSVAQAAPGTLITITGKGFTGVYGVSFNSIPGILVGSAITSIDNSSSPITIKTMNTTGLADGDTVTISGVTDQTTGKPAAINGQWVVTEVVLNSSFQLMGSAANGDKLSGGNWIDGTDSAFKAIVPSLKPNTGNTTYPGPTGRIGVRNPSGTNYSSTAFTITSSLGGPTYSGIGQAGATAANGSLNSTVTLFGTGFTGTSEVTFNGGSGSAINKFTPNANGTQLQITIPIGANGTGTFTVTAAGGTTTSTGYVFTVNAPVIASSNPFSPSSGPVGTKVTITGSGFTGADQAGGGVTFNGTAAANVQVVSDTTIIAEVAPGSTTGPVAVTTSAGTGNSGANKFTVSASPTPNITSATPNIAAVGALIQLQGTGFTGVDEPEGGITFNGTAATKFTVVNDTTINVFVPLGATNGNIVVSNASHSSNPVPFTLGPAGQPSITQFSPGAGKVDDAITLTGSGFTNVTDVEFNNTQAFFSVVNDATITAYVPNGAKTGPITATNGLGTGTSTSDFVIATQPTITSFSPDTGPAGTPVTLTGTGFTSVIQVNFNGTAATFKVNSDTSLTATVPAGATSGRITVSTGGDAARSAKPFIITARITTPDASLLTAAHGFVVAKFNGLEGVWLHDSTGWQQLTPVNPSLLATNGVIVAGEFPGYGVWEWTSANSWQQLTQVDASQLVVDPAGNVVADFKGYGVQQWLTGTTWQPLTPSDASMLAAGGTPAKPVLVGEFSDGVNQLVAPGNWTLLTSVQASLLAVDGTGNIYADFKDYGVQQWLTGTTWQQLTPVDASLLAADANGNVVGEFMGYGVWKLLSPDMWQQLTMDNASILALDDNNNALGQFMGSGILINANFVLNGWVPLGPL
jgi:hypothetical protein